MRTSGENISPLRTASIEIPGDPAYFLFRSWPNFTDSSSDYDSRQSGRLRPTPTPASIPTPQPFIDVRYTGLDFDRRKNSLTLHQNRLQSPITHTQNKTKRYLLLRNPSVALHFVFLANHKGIFCHFWQNGPWMR